MCDIFPVFQNCFLCINLRIAMLLIGVLAIVTGCITMSVSEQTTHSNFKDLMNVTSIRDPKKLMTSMGMIIHTAISALAFLFMCTGVILIYATLSDQEGFVQAFVWATFAAVLFGFIMIMAVSYECMSTTNCLLDAMDWLSGSCLLVALTGYLIFWIYLISVANSYVVQVFS